MVCLQSMDLKSQIQSSFKLSGLTVRVEAAKYLSSLLAPVPEEERQAWVDRILDQVQTQNLKTSVIEKDVLAVAVRECTNKEKGVASKVDPITVISAFETPRLTYSIERKKYLSDAMSGRPPPHLVDHPVHFASGGSLCSTQNTCRCSAGWRRNRSRWCRAWAPGSGWFPGPCPSCVRTQDRTAISNAALIARQHKRVFWDI